jgi:hypothetical protein
MEFMRLSTIKTDDRVGSTLNGLFSSAQSDISKFFRKTVKMNNLSREFLPIVDGFIASNDALIAASHLHHLGRLFFIQQGLAKTMARSLVYLTVAFVSIQSARLTGTGPVWRWTVCRILAHAVWRLITDYREYRPLVSSVRVRRQRDRCLRVFQCFRLWIWIQIGSLRASTPVDLLPFPW